MCTAQYVFLAFCLQVPMLAPGASGHTSRSVGPGTATFSIYTCNIYICILYLGTQYVVVKITMPNIFHNKFAQRISLKSQIRYLQQYIRCLWGQFTCMSERPKKPYFIEYKYIICQLKKVPRRFTVKMTDLSSP